MPPSWAEENLKVIRTLMERATIYRRALAPTTLMTGGLGVAAAVIAMVFPIRSPREFSIYWLTISLIGLIGAYLIVRRQALRESEPFWSPPTRRVTQALLPALLVGLTLGLMLLFRLEAPLIHVWWLPPIWMALYGCALHAAGFFMPRGIKLFGWIFVIGGCFLFLGVNTVAASPNSVPPVKHAHLIMGATFGGLHLAYGLYLLFTEQQKNEV